MANGLTTGDWTVYPRSCFATSTTARPTRSWNIDTDVAGRKKYVHLKLVLASGACPAAGLALPAYTQVGLRRNLEYYIGFPGNFSYTTGASTYAHEYKYFVTGNILKAYQWVLVSGANGLALKRCATTVSGPARTWYVTAVGW